MFSSEMLKVPSVFEILNTWAPKVLSQKNNTGLHTMEPLAGLAEREFIRNIGNAPEHEFNYGEFNKLLDF